MERLQITEAPSDAFHLQLFKTARAEGEGGGGGVGGGGGGGVVGGGESNIPEILQRTSAKRSMVLTEVPGEILNGLNFSQRYTARNQCFTSEVFPPVG